jgi:hypothetical protein
VSRYIHLNPKVAKIAKSLETYSWSNYPEYICVRKRGIWLKVRELLAMVNNANKELSYKRFVESGGGFRSEVQFPSFCMTH